MARCLASFVLTVALVALVVLAGALVGVRLFGLTPYAVLSGSMEPLYPVGSIVYVRAADPAAIQPGDAVTFALPSGATATHQAYAVDPSAQLVYTQGIANKNSDGSLMHDAEPVSFSSVIGVPVASIPLLGYVSVYAFTPPGSYLVIAAAAGLAVVFLLSGRTSGKDAEAARSRRQRSQGVSPLEIEKGTHYGAGKE